MSAHADRRPMLPHDPDVELGEPTERGEPVGGRRADRRAPGGGIGVLLAVALGGAAGAFARYALSVAMPSPPGQFPWGTLAVNLSGSVVLGFALVVAVERFPHAHLARPALTTGLIGAYTTFSTFAVEAVSLARDGHVGTAVAYVLATLLAGVAAAWVGIAVAGAVLRRAPVASRRSAPERGDR